jgi:hypothetical protein
MNESNGRDCTARILLLLVSMFFSGVVQAQFTYSTNRDNTINIVSYLPSAGAISITNTINGLPVTSIGTNAFEHGDLTGITIPNSVTNIGGWAFLNCDRLASATLGDGVNSISEDVFNGCISLADFIIPNSVTNIGQEAFMYCTNMSSITIPNSVTSIGYGAFEFCYSLTSATIGKNVTSIGDDAFEYSTNLVNVYFLGNAPGVGSNLFGSDTQNLYYLPGTTGWGSLLGGYPTTLLFSEPQNPGVVSNRFGFTIRGASNLVIVVEACTNTVNAVWVPIATNTLTGGVSYFSDSQWTNYPSRFYRFSLE